MIEKLILYLTTLSIHQNLGFIWKPRVNLLVPCILISINLSYIGYFYAVLKHWYCSILAIAYFFLLSHLSSIISMLLTYFLLNFFLALFHRIILVKYRSSKKNPTTRKPQFSGFRFFITSLFNVLSEFKKAFTNQI